MDELRQSIGVDSVVVAGGTDLVPLYQAGFVSASRMIDLTSVPDLARIQHGDDGLTLGATATMAEVAVRATGPHAAVADGARTIGSRQTRNAATIGGNICRASPSGDTLAPVLACGGSIVITSTRGGSEIPAEGFFLGPGRTRLGGDEVVTGIRLPHWATASAYARTTTRAWMDLATIGVAVALRLTSSGSHSRVESVRIAVSGAAPTPVLVPMTRVDWTDVPLEELPDLLPELRHDAQNAVSPIDDVRASAWYRRRMIGVLLEDVTRKAIARALDPREES